MNISENDTFKVSFKFKYDVGTPEWYFTQFAWRVKKQESLIDGWWHTFLLADSIQKTYWYNPAGTFDCLDHGVIYKDKSFTWSLDKTTNPITFIGGGKSYEKVEFINNTTMTLTSPNENGQSIERITYTTDGVMRFK